MSEFFVVDSEAVHEIKIKGSKFIGQIFKVKDEEDAEQRLSQIRKKYHNATHNCFAYRTGKGSNIKFRFSDDGEPGGTAGKPIYSVIQGNNLTYVLFIVTRYFGGTKLGTGRLIRAYSSAAMEVLKKTGLKKLILTKTIEFSLPHTFVNTVHHVIEQFNAKIIDISYTETVSFTVKIQEDKEEDFKKLIAEKSSGQVKFQS